MDRCKDYFCFAVSFAGLGYIALWTLAGCGDLFGVPLTPLVLPPALQLAGTLSAIFVGVRASLLVARRWRRPSAASAMLPPMAVPARLPRHKTLRQVAAVKPRAQFGLRGTPRL